jgi:SAM-dependent methyltransferase
VTYTHGHAESVLRSHRTRTAANSAAYLLPHLRPADRLLDVGSGPGTITADLAGLVAQVVAVEISEEAAAVTRAGLAERGVTNAEVIVGDVQALDLPDGGFDVVHAHQVLQHLTDPASALHEMARVCRPGGLIAVRDVDYAATTWFPEDPALEGWLTLYRAVASANLAEPDAGRRLLSWAHAAGLRDTVATASTYCFASPDDRQWWGRSWAGRATASAFAEQAQRYGLATAADLEEVAAAWLRWAGADDGWLGMLHGELLIRV